MRLTTYGGKENTLITSGNWNNATNSGTRYRNANNSRSNLSTNNSSHSTRQGAKLSKSQEVDVVKCARDTLSGFITFIVAMLW